MSKKNLEGKISLEEVLGKFKKHNETFKNNLEKEEAYEDSIETIDSIINDIKATKENTTRNKGKFINEIKSGLGDKVKKNPNKIKVIKKSWYQKVSDAIKNIFTKF